MTTEAAVTVETPAQPNPAVFEPVTSEVKTDAEREYFKSRGANADALFKAPEPKPAEKPVIAKTDTPTKAEEPTEDGEIIVEDSGTVRDKKTGRFVPLKSLQSEREKRQRSETEAQTLRESLIQARERLNILTEVLPKDEPKQEKTAEAEPNPETDIFAWVKWAKGRIDALDGKANKTAEEVQREREKSSLQSFFTSDVAKFQQSNADFLDALNFGINVRHKMLEAVGIKDQAVRQQRVLAEINDLVKETAKERGANPEASVAAKLYEAAKALGYVKKAPEPKKEENTAALDEIARLAKAQEASVTLGKGGSAPVGEAVTREKLASMDDAAFSSARQAYIAKHGRQAWNDFLAGRR